MTAQVCVEHPEGSFVSCGGCGEARRRHDHWRARSRFEDALGAHAGDAADYARKMDAARERYESALSAFVSAERLGEFPGTGATRGDEDQTVTRCVRDVRFTVTVERDIEAGSAVGSVSIDLRDAPVHVADPEFIRGLRVEVENGSVVVKLNAHGDEPTERGGAA